jgi:AcrR family transcriptional regulator
MRGTLRCFERCGVRGFSLEDVANEAGLSRTTIYRHFPGGRQQLVEETATWEVARFWSRLAGAVGGSASLEDRLVAGLMLGARQISDSRIMSNLMDPDLDVLVDALQPAQPLVHAVVRDYIGTLLQAEYTAGRLRSGVDIPDAADYLTRMIVSVMTSPAGIDLTDETQTRNLVRRQFTAGLVRHSPA